MKLRSTHPAIYVTLGLAGAIALACFSPGARGRSRPLPAVDTLQGVNFPDDSGQFSTLSRLGYIDQNNPFFQSLGSNGRACVDCHQPKNGWSVNPGAAQALFDATDGLSPLFRTVDGATSPTADVSTVEARRTAYSLVLSKGLIRVHLPIPENAEFALQAVDDPYGYANAADMSLFRRPLPTTNMPFLSTVMWDGRQTASGKSIKADLLAQAADAVQSHAQAMTGQTIPASVLRAIVLFETELFTAQTYDTTAGSLDKFAANGGPHSLMMERFYPGINDPVGFNPSNIPFNQKAFTLYLNWRALLLNRRPPMNGPRFGLRPGPGRGPQPPQAPQPTPQQMAVERGEALFNTKPIQITGVAGLNDVVGRPVIQGTCTTCHDTPNVGSHSVPVMLNIGVADAVRRTPDMPLYTLVNTSTGVLIQTTDPGRALVTGNWNDIGKFKVPVLRGLESRSPYFHNGSMDSLENLINFYNTRFGIGFTDQEKDDLAAFLRTL